MVWCKGAGAEGNETSAAEEEAGVRPASNPDQSEPDAAGPLRKDRREDADPASPPTDTAAAAPPLASDQPPVPSAAQQPKQQASTQGPGISEKSKQVPPSTQPATLQENKQTPPPLSSKVSTAVPKQQSQQLTAAKARGDQPGAQTQTIRQ